MDEGAEADEYESCVVCVTQEGGDDTKEKWPWGEDPEKKDGVGMSCQQ